MKKKPEEHLELGGLMEEASKEYAINFSQGVSSDYIEGFSDGYSRAWKECWDYMIEHINALKDKPTESK